MSCTIDYQVFRRTGDQIQQQGYLRREWQRGEYGSGCLLRRVLDNAGLSNLSPYNFKSWQDPTVRSLLTTIHNHLMETSPSYVAICREAINGNCERRYFFFTRKTPPVARNDYTTFIVRWHDHQDRTVQEVVAAMHSLAYKLEAQQLCLENKRLQARNDWLERRNVTFRRLATAKQYKLRVVVQDTTNPLAATGSNILEPVAS